MFRCYNKDILESAEYTGQGGRNQKEGTYIKRALSEYIPGVFPQITFVGVYQPEIVSVGIGGNDAGFMNKLKSCIGPGTCEWAKEGAVRQALAKEIDALSEVYARVIDSIKSRAPHADLRMISYPQIISDAKDAKCGAFLNSLLSFEGRQFISRSIERVSHVMYTAAQASGVRFVDVGNAHGEHKLCNATSTPAMNAIRLGGDFSPIASLSNFKIIGAESFHPTPYGHELVADILAQSFASTTVGRAMLARNAPSVDDAYWQRGSDGAEAFRYQQLSPDIAYVVPGGEYSEITPAGVFAPDSKVILTIQDGEVVEQLLIASANGEVSYSVLTSVLRRDGVYTVYLHGATPSGERIVLYRMIAVGADEDITGDVGVLKNVPDAIDTGSVNTNSPKHGNAEALVQKAKDVLGITQQVDTKSLELQGVANSRQTQSFPYLVLLYVIGAATLLAISVQVVRYARRMSKGRDNKV